MNTKKQAVWLVSMLGIMVLLSAYYLFTEPNESQKVANHQWLADGNHQEVMMTKEEQDSKKDQETIQQMQHQTKDAKDIIAIKQMKRVEDYTNHVEKLQSIVNDMNKTPGEAGKATEELIKLDENEQVITGLEEEFAQKYGDAVITKEDNKYNVIVQSEQFATKEAVQILDKVMEELHVTQDKISVQHIQPRI